MNDRCPVACAVISLTPDRSEVLRKWKIDLPHFSSEANSSSPVIKPCDTEAVQRAQFIFSTLASGKMTSCQYQNKATNVLLCFCIHHRPCFTFCDISTYTYINVIFFSNEQLISAYIRKKAKMKRDEHVHLHVTDRHCNVTVITF